MRIFTAIIGVLLAVAIFAFFNDVSLVQRVTDNDQLGAIASAALVGAILCGVGGALAIPYPMFASIAFLLAFVIMGLVQLSTDLRTDLIVYLWGPPILSLTAYRGWKGKLAEEKRTNDLAQYEFVTDALRAERIKDQLRKSISAAGTPTGNPSQGRDIRDAEARHEPPAGNAGLRPDTAISTADEVKKLFEMKQSGALSEDEFQKAKSKLIEM